MKKKEQVSTEETVDVQNESSLVLYNDDFNTFDHVINCLIKICKHTPEAAEQCAFIVHYRGKCAVKHGTYEDLEPRCVALLDQGLSAVIEM
ncbi:MAG: ATP-dependent Clp protease adaptor ClpS [Flavobacteriia bacterium]|jgi:ATP-dependent Clp protease adaptor protein ClpS|nr:ATP-dependent Clp protease adaptor ClpS [Flavobacteriia bacterium]NBX39561.1 ATP-dependent Clp protease adaptor ClpS [Flavobacteriia bacterium]